MIRIKNSTEVICNENSLNDNTPFKIAVVMAIYNTEEFLPEAINSVLNQTLKFEDNIQLILVDDGSKDNSLKICKEYQKKYPKNIIVITQENSGQATARNNGLKYVNAEFVNFLDSDDYFSLKTFENVYDFFKKHSLETDIVSVPIKFFGRINSEHRLNFKYDCPRIIDLNLEPYNPQYHANSSFFNIDVLKEIQFPLDVIPSEDAVLINKILLNKRTLGVVKEGCYYYRKREDQQSTIDLNLQKKEYYTGRLKNYFLGLINYSLKNYGEIPKFLEYTIAYDLHWMLGEPEISFTKNQDEINEFYSYLDKVISYISIDTIKNLNIENSDLKAFFLYLKNGECHIDLENDLISLKTGNIEIDRVNQHKFWLDIIELKDDYLNISGAYNGLINNKYFSIESINEISNGKIEKTLGEYKYYPSRDNQYYLSKKWKYIYNFDIRIPIYHQFENNVKLRINFHIDGDGTNFNENNLISNYLEIDFQFYANIYKYSNYIVNKSQILLFTHNQFKITSYNYLKNLKLEYHCLKKINEDKRLNYKNFILLRVIYTILLPIMNIITRDRPIYLFMDRITDAQDNAEVLWEYSLKKDDNVKKYFIIDKNSKDYHRLSDIGDVISYKSFKHKLLFLFADKIISSHPEEDILNPFYSETNDNRRLICGLVTIEKYFLQHGVIQNNISHWLSKYDKNLSYFLTSSEYEKDSLIETLGYHEEVYHVLGLPRFDNLKNSSSNQILICPTWRYNLMGRALEDKYNFLDSDYFKDLNELLNNEKIIKLSEEHNYELIFKPHPRMTTAIGDGDETYFDLLNINNNIKIVSDESYNSLLNNSSLMITDYSSVAFDFAYLKKPILYYQPNNDLPHEEGYFNYETMGFGDVVSEIDELIDKIQENLQNKFKNKEEYNKRVDYFFKYHDKNNCERVYDSIFNDSRG